MWQVEMSNNLKEYVTRFARRGLICAPLQHTRFPHHSIDTLSDSPCVHVLWPTVHQSAFPEACQMSMNARFVFTCLCWLSNKCIHAFLKYVHNINFNISKRDFSIFMIACKRPFWQIRSHMHNCFTW